MMDFPQESIDRARAVVKQYRQRSTTKFQLANCINGSYFLEITYGFNDALQSGRFGHFLHEVKSQADCFSLAGINYLLAREAGLNPTLYAATGLKNVINGTDAKDSITGDHAFITVPIKGKTLLIDPFHHTMGYATFNSTHINVKEAHNSLFAEESTLTYESLRTLTEDEFITMLLHNRTPEGGRLALSAGQKIKYPSHNQVLLTYIPETQELSASMDFDIACTVTQEPTSRLRFFELRAPTHNGQWEIESGIIRTGSAPEYAWNIEKIRGIHLELKFPLTFVHNYLQSIEHAHKNSGKKIPVNKVKIREFDTYFKKLGFSLTGAIESAEFINSSHQKLKEELDKYAKEYTINPEFEPFISQRAVYRHQKINNQSPENPSGSIFSKKEHEEFINEYIEKYAQYQSESKDKLFKTMLAQAGFEKHAKEKVKEWTQLKNKISDIQRFGEILIYHKRRPILFEELIDISLWERKHPLGTLHATTEEKNTFYQYNAHRDLCSLTKILPYLKLKKYEKGIKQLLR